MAVENNVQTRTQAHVRAFLQFGGPNPANAVKFGGVDTNDVTITGIEAPVSGDSSAINIHNPKRIGAYKQVGRTTAPPDLSKATLTVRQRIGKKIPRFKMDMNCLLGAFLAYYDDCNDVSDHLLGWDYIEVYPEARITSRSFGDPSAFMDSNPIEATLGLEFRERPYPVGQMNFGADGITLTGEPLTDVVYSGHVACGNCGSAADDGSQWIYASTNSVTGAKPGIYYSVNGGSTWTAVSVTTAAIDDDFNAIAVVGKYLVVLCRTASSATIGGYFYSEINQITGVPSSTFTKVVTGFVANQQPNDILVLGPNEVYIVADAGIIYKSTDITAGVSVLNNGGTTANNLMRIDGNNNIMVAVGASNTVIYSENGGITWSTTTSNPTVTSGVAVAVIDNNRWWVGGTAGRLWYTFNGGETWTEKTFTGSSAGSVTDVIAVTPEVIFFTHNTAAPVARVFASFDGGYSFTNTAPRVTGLPTFTGATRAAVPTNADVATAVNNLAIAGTGVLITAGYMVRGVASSF